MKLPIHLLTAAFAIPALTSTGLAGETLAFTPLSSVRNGEPAELFDASAAEIVKFDAVTKRMFVVNGAADTIDIFDASNPASPALLR
ncbi:MAG: hypothetical protein KDN05_18830, partial [Verrucomicrobiae bacterium]|nr:hypothetical protein [Verrucomicrobiae bacterium]